MKHFAGVFSLWSFVFFAGCSRGSLYEGDDFEMSAGPVLTYTQPGEQAFGLAGSYGSSNSLFYGVSDGYEEITMFSSLPTYSGDDSSVNEEKALDASMMLVTRHLIRRKDPADLQRIILQPQGEFDPFSGADCVLTLKGSLQKEDQCEGAAKCKLYRVENIFAAKDGDTCDFPTVKSFVAKFDSSMLTAEVIQPGTDTWIQTNKINFFDTKSIPIRISDDKDQFSSVIATTSAKGYVFAGKRYEKNVISASFTDRTGSAPIQTVPLEGISTEAYFVKAQTRNVLITVTSSGIFKLGSEDKWEVLPLPSGLSAMPVNVKKAYAASGVGIAAFRFVFTDAGSEKNLLLVYTEASNTVEVVDHTSISLDQTGPADGIPSGYTMMIVNESLWFWNAQIPALSKKFDQKENKWEPVALTLPLLTEAGSSPKHIISPAGTGFVLTISYPQNISVNLGGGESVPATRTAFRNFYFDGNGQAQGTPVSTFSPPDAMHMLNGKIYFERVLGIDFLGADKIMDYGYIYDFATGTGKIFQDVGFDRENKDRLADFAGIIVNDDQSVLFYGGCEKPADIQQCLSANPLARLVKFNSR